MMDWDWECPGMEWCQVDLPYPPVRVETQNLHYARLVSGAFAGAGSETTAIAQYTAHNFHTEAHPEVFRTLRCITFVEMRHLDILGRLIKMLGADPIFASYETRRYWSGEYPAYRTEIAELLAADIQGERDAIAHYRRLIEAIDDRYMRELFRRIIIDEEKHIELLTPLYQAHK